MKPNMQMTKGELTGLAEEAGHKVSAKMKKAEILSLLTIRPEVVETVVETVVQAPAEVHWCMYCVNYVKAPKHRPHMVCKVRGGVREPNAGTSIVIDPETGKSKEVICVYFERKS